jgi:hopanoid biosynthesis associated protein HpnK
VKRLIVTADDFGLCEPVNEAVEIAHRDGILSTASLMVGGSAAADAVARARRLPELRVGLHVVVVEDRPVLPGAQVGHLTDGDGYLSRNLVTAGVRFFFDPAARRQLEAEIRAQFEAFAATGLTLDHVNAHNHMHLHPTVLGIILRVGREFGLCAMRVPYEPPLVAWRVTGRGLGPKLAAAAGLAPWLGLLRARLQRRGIRANDVVLGLGASGAMDETTVLRLLELVPDGRVAEMYFHPATRRSPESDRTMPSYRQQAELAALTSPRVRRALETCEIRLVTFADLAGS